MMRSLLLLAFVSVVIGVSAQTSQPSPAADYVLDNEVAIPMRDGVVLKADLLRPTGVGPFPTLVYRTPYGKENALKEYSTFVRAVQRGYAVIVQDVRGRYSSAGEFQPYEQEGRDGYDTIEWAARQPWSNGAVGTFGLSYPGAVQWLAAVENPPHLKAMVPAMTFSTPQNFFYAGGTWDMSWIEWIWDNIAPDVRVKKDLAGPRTYDEAIAAWNEAGPKMQRELPLKSLSELKGIAPFYYRWLEHPADDPWWDWCELRNKYDRVHAAVLNLSAWYDDNYGPEGATTNYLGLLASRRGEADPRTQLLLGPWVHGVDNTGKTKSGDREFAANAAIKYDEVVLRWLDHYVRGVDNGVQSDKPVRYYAMGANTWREGTSWPPASHETSYYFQVTNHAASGEKGKLSLKKPVSSEISLVSDPATPVLNKYGSSGAHDYRDLANRPDVLTFDSEPLTADIEVTGPITVDVFVSCDCRDFDLWARLLDVAPDGTAFNLMSPGLDVLRASYRDVRHGRQPLNPGQVYELRLEHLLTGNVFQKGHRIRVQVSGSFFPNFSRNLQSGELEAVSSRMQKATIRVYTGGQRGSRVILPVINDE
jgi:putative CocE/NonD family hydrolase